MKNHNAVLIAAIIMFLLNQSETSESDSQDDIVRSTALPNDETTNDTNVTKGHGSDGGEKHVEKDHINYRNPFDYEPKPFVFFVIFVGAFLMMAAVLSIVVLSRKFCCPRLVAWRQQHDGNHSTSTRAPNWILKPSSLIRKHSITESHLELPKQDSLENFTELDNDSFLASLENVSFSVTPPASRRFNNGAYMTNNVITSPITEVNTPTPDGMENPMNYRMPLNNSSNYHQHSGW